MKTLVFYRCRHCGNVIVKTVDSGVPVHCCGEAMETLIPQSTENGTEKHLPIVSKNCRTASQDCYLRVQVGSALHPMTDEHLIQWVCLENADGFEVRFLAPGTEPVVEFCNCGGGTVAVYAYCNLHRLWKTVLK